MMSHDFKKFPELTNGQMDIYYFESPHRQITSPFHARVVKVTDGDTLRVDWYGRDFDFPLRFINIAAPETKEKGGGESQSWLEDLLLGEEIDVIVNRDNRVEKWGRLLGYVYFQGMDVGQRSIMAGHSIPWEQRSEGRI